MESFWKAIILALIAAILILEINSKSKEFGTVLSLAVCCMVSYICLDFLQPVVSFLQELEELADLHGDFLLILLKTLAVSLTAELAGLICTDSGNQSLGKLVHHLGNSVIVYLSLPIFTALIGLLKQLMGEL